MIKNTNYKYFLSKQIKVINKKNSIFFIIICILNNILYFCYELLIFIKKMDLQNQTFELLEQTATNWTVNKLPLVTENGLSTESYGMFRNDNNLWLGTIGKQYEPMHNFEVAETLIATTEEISEKHRGGMLFNGKKVFYQSEIKPIQVANDEVKRFVTILNSHDGSSSIGFGFSNTVVVCQNTFYKAMKEVQKFRHTTSASERLGIARKQVREILLAENEVMEIYQKMADTKINNKAIKLVISDLFDLKEEDIDKPIEDFSTRKVNDIAKFKQILDSELASHGETIWGLFNAVTWKTNHADIKRNNQLENVMVGSGYKKNNSAFKTLSELVY
jgi:phage/plasmid-like protein (TIGR03299 family)